MYRLLSNKERIYFFRTITICILCFCVSIVSYGQVKNSPDSNRISKNQLEYTIILRKNFKWSVSPVLTPPEYKNFDNDPLELFTRIGLRVTTNFRYSSQPGTTSELGDDHLLSINYGFLRKTFVIGYVGKLKELVGKWDGLLKARYDVVAAQNFYGLGNNTINDLTTARNFYVSSSNREYVSAGLSRDFSDVHHVEASLFYQRIEVSTTGNHFITGVHPDQPDFNATVFAPKQFGGVEVGYRFNNTNSEIYPTKGMRFVLGGGYVHNINDNNRSFLKGVSSLSLYVPLTNSFTLAMRAGGGTLTGDADYYHLNTLGGNENLRGYPRERFYGRTSFYNNNELRWIAPVNNFLSGTRIGLLAFFDQGRVWQPGEISTLWHTGYGGGLILMPFNKITLTGTYGISKEGRQILLQSYIFF